MVAGYLYLFGFNFAFADSVEHLSLKGGCIQDYRNTFNGRLVDKYYPGTAICFLPFFAIAHSYCLLTDEYLATGYSKPYFFWISIAGWVFLQLGLWFTNKVLQELKFNDFTRFFTLLFLMLGSNLISYGIDQPSYSHIYSFTILSASTYYCLKAYHRFSVSDFTIMFFLFGWAIIIRPVNITWVLFLLIFVLNPYVRKNLFKQLIGKPQQMLLYVLSFVVMPLLLFCLFYLSSGQWLLYSYSGERFYFSDPNTFKFLFSQDNGMVLYTPILGISLLMGFFCVNKDRPIVTASLLVLLITIYVHSSWWCWWYGHGFGSRTLLDFNVLFALLIAFALSSFKFPFRLGLLVLFAFGSFLTIILYHQSGHGYLNPYPRSDYFQAIAAFFTN